MQITKTAIRRPVTVSMFVVAVMLFGVVSLQRLPLNLLPDISYPSLTVQTELADTAPAEIEALITRPVEEQVGVVSGLRRLTSVSRSDQSEVVLEFAWGTNMDFAAMDVREKLDGLTLPEDAVKPVVLRFDPSQDPIMRIQIFGEVSLSQLRYLGEKELKQGLELSEGVAAVKVLGGREEQILIDVDEERLAELGIPITELTNILRQENLNQASGSLYDQDARYMVRMLNEFRSIAEIQRIIVRDQQGRKVILADIADVRRGTKDREVIARLNGNESVELAIYKEGDANTVTVSRAVRAKLASLEKGPSYPKGISYEIVFDQAGFISDSVNNVRTAALFGGLLATVILFIFLRDGRSTVIIALSIPISIMATFALMYQTDISLNIMSLGGVALGVGMLVDNSIVVLEAVARHRRAGVDLADAAYRGTQEVGMAVTASTLTTVAVFLPLVFVEGIAGQLFKDQALTITYSLLTSLVVALTFIPMVLGLRVKRGLTDDADARPEGSAEQPAPRPPGGARLVYRDALWLGHWFVWAIFSVAIPAVVWAIRFAARELARLLLWVISPLLNLFQSGFQSLEQFYPRVLEAALNRKPLVFASVSGLVILSFLLYGQLGGELIPALSQGEFAFEILFPQGTPIDTTDRAFQSIEKQIRALPDVQTVFSSVGGSRANQFSQSAVEENVGQIHVLMKDRQDRVAEERAIARIRDQLGQYPDADYIFERPTLFSLKTPIEIEVYAFDLGDQRRAAEQVVAGLAAVAGLSDIQSTTKLGSPEIQIRFDRARLARLGLDETRISEILRNKIRGDVASRYREQEKQIEILVRAHEEHRNTIADLSNLVISDQGNTNSAASTGQNNSSGARQTSAGQASGNTGSANNSNQNQRSQANQASPQGQGVNAEQTQSTAPIRLGAVADIQITRGPAEVRRIRSQRSAVVSANLAGRDLSSVSGDIRVMLQKLRPDLPLNTVVGLAGQNEEAEQSFRSLQFALALAVFLVYLVMASQFESLTHPLVILFTVPLALVGVVLSLYVSRTPVSVMVLLGVIVLAGIVVNNAIILVDYTNQLRREGVAKREAILRAGQVRLRPIFMTTLTTVLGLFPMALGWGEGSEVRAPMAITVMGGLMLATLLTLVLIPVVYEVVDRGAPVPFEADAEPSELDTGMEQSWGTLQE
ncbi:MAG: efflux RND transporter permease subunit [Acidobacteria bacterium]|nr:efflux RND transporter permease subunit [Acidobacteriota bacterium]